MRSRIAFALFMFAIGCATTRVSRPWSLDLATSGGITGRGIGNIRIDSEGTATVGQCTSNVTAEDLARLEALIRNARPDSWRESYAPENRCCDRIEYTLLLETGGRTWETEWIDDPLPMPAGLTAIGDALVRELRARPCGAP